MATDAQLSRNFWLSEAPCWWHANAEEIGRLQESTARVLQPTRNRWGETIITSWMWWRDGCEARTGSHSWGGTIDYVVPGADLWEVFEWSNSYLMPSGYIGRLIYEPDRFDEKGKKIQGEHIHMAPRADMVGVYNDPVIKSMRETDDGTMYVYQDWAEGTFADPYELDPLVVTATAGWGWPGIILGLGLLFSFMTLNLAGQSQGGWTLRSQQ